MNRRLKFALGMIVPYSIATLYRQRRIENGRREILEKFSQARAQSVGKRRASYDYDASIAQLGEWGLDPIQVVRGSMPFASLQFCSTQLANSLDMTQPRVGLQIGNFVGVAACYWLDWLSQQNENSRLISIDPNIFHLGIENPQHYATRLIEQFGLSKYHVLIVGYSLYKNFGNDMAHDPRGGNPFARIENEAASENVLHSLRQLGMRFDFVILDGNHHGDYLREEIDALLPMLNPQGILIVDDVNDAWQEVRQTYESIVARADLIEIGRNGRVGILQKRDREA